MNANELKQRLRSKVPQIAFRVNWEHDPDSGPVSKECDGFDPSEDDEWQAWQTEVSAMTVIDGEEVTGTAYLGGTFERAGDDPETSNPDISGYLPQMLLEAVEELPEGTEGRESAIFILEKELRDRYEEQRREATNA